MAFAQAPTYPVSAGGTGPVGPLYVKKRIIPVSEYTDYAEWQESTVTNRAALYALVHAVDPTIPLNAIMIDRVLCGGGGGGPSGVDSFGGFGGFVTTDTIALSALSADSDIHIEIGAGGAGTDTSWGMQGSQTNFIEYKSGSIVFETFISASGGDGGSVNLESMNTSYRQCLELGIQMPDPSVKIGTFAAGSFNSPGCGAWSSADDMISGGTGSRGQSDPILQFGEGGRSLYGLGESGYLGGGGGASSPENFGADGGDGVTRLRFWIMESLQ